MFARVSLTAILLMEGAALPVCAADAPITRTPLQSAEAPDAAHSVQSYLVTVAANATVARHTHPGVEMGLRCIRLAHHIGSEPDRPIGEAWRLLGVSDRGSTQLG